MTLTTDQVFEMISAYGERGSSGRAAFLRRTDQARMRSELTSNQQALLEDVAAAGALVSEKELEKRKEEEKGEKKDPTTYAHPAREARVHRTGAPRGVESRPTSLTSAQVAWLNRLPAEPDKVSYTDAVEVFRLAAGNVAPSDMPLVRALAEPLRAFHDRNEAKAALLAAQKRPQQIPASAIGALVDAIAAENGQLRPNEVLNRADDMLTELSSSRLRAYEERLAAARQRVELLDAADAARTAVTR